MPASSTTPLFNASKASVSLRKAMATLKKLHVSADELLTMDVHGLYEWLTPELGEQLKQLLVEWGTKRSC